MATSWAVAVRSAIKRCSLPECSCTLASLMTLCVRSRVDTEGSLLERERWSSFLRPKRFCRNLETVVRLEEGVRVGVELATAATRNV